MTRITKSPHPFEHHEVDLLNAGDADLKEIASTLGLGLSLDEFRHIRDGYVVRERKATDLELQTYDQTWSEHCSHKTFGGIIHTPEETVDGLLKTYFRGLIDESDATVGALRETLTILSAALGTEHALWYQLILRSAAAKADASTRPVRLTD